MIKSFLAKQLAKYQNKVTQRDLKNPIETQEKLFLELIKIGKKTAFGNGHNFNEIKSISDYQKQVSIADYEKFRPYIERIIAGEKNVLWKGLPQYFNKTSGTTSGVKYIPMTKESLPHNIKAARSALLAHITETKDASWVNGKMIFLSGSPELSKKGAVNAGRMSGIVNHHIPAYLRSNQLPSYTTNCINDWETKLEKIVEETINENMTFISGIPPWMQMYFDLLLEKSGKETIKELFPNLKVIVHGGVNFQPYKAKMEATVGEGVAYIETYPASEGFIAYQNSQKQEGLLLNLDAGIFYEFIPADEVFGEQPTRLTIADVELNKNYAIILTTNAGLWSYLIGDTVKFVSLKPYRIVVTGRTKHFISAFGEHVIAEEVEKAMATVIQEFDLKLREFSVAPQVNPKNEELPYHEWLIELEENISFERVEKISIALDKEMCKLNTYYDDLIKGGILQALKLTILPVHTFEKYMASIGKLGGQNKLPRLANDRKIADAIDEILKQ